MYQLFKWLDAQFFYNQSKQSLAFTIPAIQFVSELLSSVITARKNVIASL